MPEMPKIKVSLRSNFFYKIDSRLLADKLIFSILHPFEIRNNIYRSANLTEQRRSFAGSEIFGPDARLFHEAMKVLALNSGSIGRFADVAGAF